MGIKKTAGKQIGELFRPPNNEADAIDTVILSLVESCLSSKVWEIRSAGTFAIEHILKQSNFMILDCDETFDIDTLDFDLDELIDEYPSLVASAGSVGFQLNF